MTPDEQLADAQDAWQVAFERGHDRPVAELLPDHPDLHPELERRVAVLRRMIVVNQPLATVTQDPAMITAGSPENIATAGPVDRPAMPSAIAPPPGFTFERELGRGGMGVVYLAHQHGLNRPIALKMVLGSASPGAVIRFLAEAEAVAAVKHPNVVEVYQFGEHQGKPYLVLEFCPGGDLTVRTKAGRTAQRAAAELMAAVADGVNAAHSAGIVHRDLKPGNILLAADGTPKVSDFGLAKKGGGADLTGSEAVLGTAAYMSPEQAGGGAKFVGPECDVWALGVMLYELLTGLRPFVGPSFLDYRIQILGRQLTPLRQALPNVPRDLELIVAKCLRQEPRERYATAGELAADLRNWLTGQPISARPMGSVEAAWKWSRRNPAVAGSLAVAVLALVVGTVVSLWQAHESQTASKNEIAQRIIAEQKTEMATRAEAAMAVQLMIAKERTISLNEIYGYIVFDTLDQLRYRPGTLSVRRQLLQTSYSGLSKILDDARIQATPDSTIVWIHIRRGEIAEDFGDLSASEKEYQAGYELAQRLVDADPKNNQAHFALGICFKKIGDVALEHGHTKDALDFFSKYNQITQELVDADPKNAQVQREWGVSLSKLGDVALKRGQSKNALKLYLQHNELAQKVADTDPSNTLAKRHLSISFQKIGDVMLEIGQPKVALDYYRKCLKIDQWRVGVDLEDVLAQSDLSVGYDRLGDVTLKLGQAKNALDFYRKSLDIRQKLADADPKNSQAQRDLGFSFSQLGEVTLKLGQSKDALDFYHKSLDIRHKLADADPKNAQAQRDLSVSFDELSNVTVALGQPKDALDFSQKSLDIRQKLADADPENAQAQRDLSVSFEKVGDATRKLDQPKEALEFYRKSMHIRLKLADADPKNAQAQRDLGVSFSRLGEVTLKLGQSKDALDFYRKSLDIDQKLADADPKNAQAQRDLSVSLSQLGEVTLKLGQSKDALDFYRKSLDIDQKLADANPKDTQAQHDLSLSTERIGDAARELKDYAEAIRWYEKALAIAEKLEPLELFTNDVKRQKQEISVCQAELNKIKPREKSPAKPPK